MNLKRISETLILLLSAVLLAVALFAQSGQAPAKQGTIEPQRAVRSPLLKEPPQITPQELKRLEEILGHTHVPIVTPADPTVSPETIQPTNPQTVPNVPSQLPQESAAPAAPGTFTLYRNSSVVPLPNANTSTTNEPSLGVNGRAILYTGNWYAAVSGDRGQTFSYINPFSTFPAVNGGFCCDQIAYHERTRGATVWLLQYSPDNNTNTYRLAVARGQADLLNNNWFYYDFTPATFGFAATGFWLDYPDLAVSDNFLYLTANVFPRVLPNPLNPCAGTCPGGAPNPCPAVCGGVCTNPCTGRGAVIARLPLNQLADGQTLSFNYYTDTHSGYRCTHGARQTMYWGSHNWNTQIRIYRWDESSTQNPAWDDVNHGAYNTCPATNPNCMSASGPDGRDWAGFADGRILGAWVANNVIGFMWNAAQGGGFTYPHVQVLRFNESNRSLLDQGQVFNNTNAWLYPSVHTNDRGHLGGTIAWGGGSFNPNAAAWIADDFNGGTITPLENLTFAVGNSGPATNRWGDYLTTRGNFPYGNSWAGTGYSLVGGSGNANVVARYVSFGRERDAPPARDLIFVSLFNTSRYEDGSFFHPYRTVGRGNFAAMPGDTISIVPGNYDERPVLNRPSVLERLGQTGVVTVGKP